MLKESHAIPRNLWLEEVWSEKIKKDILKAVNAIII
jgi:hypothetical protein